MSFKKLLLVLMAALCMLFSASMLASADNSEDEVGLIGGWWEVCVPFLGECLYIEIVMANPWYGQSSDEVDGISYDGDILRIGLFVIGSLELEEAGLDVDGGTVSIEYPLAVTFLGVWLGNIASGIWWGDGYNGTWNAVRTVPEP